MKADSREVGATIALVPVRASNGGALGCARSTPSGATTLLEKHGNHNQPKQPVGRVRFRVAVMKDVLVEKLDMSSP